VRDNHRSPIGRSKGGGRIVSSHVKTRAVKPLLADLQGPLAKLVEAYERARETRQPVWDFALSFAFLQQRGLTDESLRWLWRHGYADCVVTASRPRAAMRRNGALPLANGSKQPWVVLTTAGSWFFRIAEVASGRNGDCVQAVVAPDGDGLLPPRLPRWDADWRQLRLGEHVVKWFRRPAENQEWILASFQELNWSRLILDPLKVAPEIRSQDRLHFTIRNLNRAQKQPGVHFSASNNGRAISWQLDF
jgi:hypothetical protein